MSSVGERLKNKRLEKGIHLEEIASITKIPLYSLRLIEENRWDDLPAQPFVRGFIMSYARFLEIPHQELIEDYLKESTPSRLVRAPSLPSLSSPPRDNGVTSTDARATEANTRGDVPSRAPYTAPRPSMTRASESITRWVQGKISELSLANVATSIVALGVGILVWRIMVIGKEVATSKLNANHEGGVHVATLPTLPEPPVAPQPLPSVPVASSGAPTPENSKIEPPLTEDNHLRNLAASKSPTPPVTTRESKLLLSDPSSLAPHSHPASKPLEASKSPSLSTNRPLMHHVTLRAKDRSWVRVVRDDSPPQKFVLYGGDEKEFSAHQKIKVVLGNADAVDVTHNGEISLGRVDHGTIRYFIFPLGSKFPQDHRTMASTDSKEEMAVPPPQESTEAVSDNEPSSPRPTTN